MIDFCFIGCLFVFCNLFLLCIFFFYFYYMEKTKNKILIKERKNITKIKSNFNMALTLETYYRRLFLKTIFLTIMYFIFTMIFISVKLLG